MRRTCIAVTTALVIVACNDTMDPSAPLEYKPASAALVDLDPAAPGIFISNASPQACFADQATEAAPDSDKDWLRDTCELAIAQAFAPEWRFAWGEDCNDWEPAWAAKYHPAPFNVVRVAYMPAYYEDCGAPAWVGYSDHPGDSEFVMVEVKFNASTNHWEFQRMWLSSHYGTSNDHSQWSSIWAEFPDRDKGYPRVWASLSKHANYSTQNNCNYAQWEQGCGGGPAVRFPVAAHRNAGSRHVDHLGCVFSEGARSGTGRCETFYASGAFRGWTSLPTTFGSAGHYRKSLMSKYFELNETPPLGISWGPGPYPPGVTPPYSTYISGPSWVRPGALCQWFLQSGLVGGVEWIVNGEVIGTGYNLWHSFTQDTVLSVIVSVPGESEDDAIQIIVSESAPECSTQW